MSDGLDERGRVTVVGEALIDLVPGTTKQTFTALPGGSPYNVAIGLSRLGITTTLMARLSDTAFGRALRDRAAAEGVDLSRAPRADEQTTLAVVSLDDQARASYDFYTDGTADWQWTAQELAAVPADSRIVHYGSLASWTAPGADEIRAHVAQLRARGSALISYDPNVRPLLLREPAAARAPIERCVATAHLVKASIEDVEWLYPDVATDEVAHRWIELGADVVILTDGPAGARVLTNRGEQLTRPGREVDVVDTVGAGDSFTAALLAGLVRRGAAGGDQLQALGVDGLGAVIDEAVLASAITCTRAGADPPTVVDVARGL